MNAKVLSMKMQRAQFNIPLHHSMFLDSHLLLHSIDALLVPRTEIVRHFRDSGLAFTKCGNPFKIVGKAAKPEVCVCVCVCMCVCVRERERERV